MKPDCYLKGGGKCGQGPRQRRFNKWKEKNVEESVAVAKVEDEELFAFTCTSDYHTLTNSLKLPKDKCDTCMDSGTSEHYCPEWEQFQNLQPLENCDITTADGWILKAVGIGDIHIDLPNGNKHTPALLKNTVYAPDMAFTLISVGHLNKANCSVTFQKGMCTIQNPNRHIMGTIPMAMAYIILSTLVKETLQARPILPLVKCLSVKLTINSAISHTVWSKMPYQMNRLQELSLIWTQSPSFVNPVQRLSQLGFHSHKNWIHMQRSMVREYIGTSGDLLQSQVLVGIVM